MKSFKIFALSLLISALTFSVSKAHAEAAHILSGSTSSSLIASQSSPWSDDYEFTFGLGVGYDYAFDNGFQLGGIFGAQLFSGGSTFTVAAGPGYNFNKDIKNSFFVAFNFGVVTEHTDALSSETDTFITLGVGKRFSILENISYVPGLKIEKELKSNSNDPSFILEVVRFSILF